MGVGMLSYRSHVVDGSFRQDEEPCLPNTDLGTPASRGLRDWWWSRARAIPTKAEFDILDHWPVAPDVFLVRALPGGTFRTLLIGEGAKGIIEPGRLGADIRPHDPRHHLAVLRRHYAAVVSTRLPRLCRGTLARDGEERIFEGLDCPLADPDGSVTHIVGVLSILR